MLEMLGKKEDLHEVDWVKEQTKSALSGLQKEVLYTKNGDEVKFDVDTSLNYLKTLKDKKSYSEVMKDNPGATVMAVQILLKNKGYNIGKIDGILKTQGKSTSKTMEAIAKFQSENGLTDDGAPGPDTIKKLLEVYENGGGNNKSQQPKAPEEKLSSQVLTLAELKKYGKSYIDKNLYLDNRRCFKKGVEKKDNKGRYIEINGKKIYNQDDVRNLGEKGIGYGFYSGNFYLGQFNGDSCYGWGIISDYIFHGEYLGEWKPASRGNPIAEGQGIYYSNGSKEKEGQWKDDELWTGMVYDKDGKTVIERWKDGKKVD